MIKIFITEINTLNASILSENEALKKVEILSLSQESVISVDFGSNATRTRIPLVELRTRGDNLQDKGLYFSINYKP